MAKYRVAIQVIHVYYLEIEAKNEGDACGKAFEMGIAEIEEKGRLKGIETDHAEVREVIDG